jgi:hypothetical protein
MERAVLRPNQNLHKISYTTSVTESQVLFSLEFKLKAIELHGEGLRPSDIFQKLGIGPNLFRNEYSKKTIHRWEMIYREH